MKAYSTFKDFVSEALLLEVGESSARSFDYEKEMESQMATIYSFITDSGVEYELEASRVSPELDHIVQIVFSVDGSVETVVNRGELFRVMATVMQITREVLDENPEFRVIAIEPSKNSPNDLRRQRLYLAYIKNEWPDAIVKRKGDEIYVKIK